jgi:hypothetical protein
MNGEAQQILVAKKQARIRNAKMIILAADCGQS